MSAIDRICRGSPVMPRGPVENFLVEVRAEEFFFVADNIGKA